MRIAVLCPSRDRDGGDLRPRMVCRLHDSMLATSTSADLIVRIDDDQRSEYEKRLPRERLTLRWGPRVGVAASFNENARAAFHAGYDVFGAVVDFAELKTPGWDRYLAEVMEPAIPELVSPAHSNGQHLDFPFVNREWLEVMGYLVPEAMKHWGWNTALELIGDSVGMRWADPARFFIEHRATPTDNDDVYERDAKALFDWIYGERRTAINRLRAYRSLQSPVIA